MVDTPKNAPKPKNSAMPPELDPVKFMRSLHPDLYSDSVTIAQPVLPKELFEYYLETITSRSQETEFAYFCRRLAEKEICPNLRPQTGPTGGGDSKADSETIPVSDEISLRWIGTNPQAGQEQWAFAFSAKKDWKAKVRSDVEGIANTHRGYSKIYFITNQFARDKDRALIEDELKAKFGIPVHILDRSWILTAVFEHDRIEVAVEALRIHELSLKSERKIGPRDLEREQELKELNTEIGDTGRYRGAEYQLVEDCLRAALLARGLERPRTEVDGYFARADRIAEKVGHRQQRLRIAYNYAWTALWWYDDYDLLNALYDTVEKFAIESNQASDVELLQNLWQLLVASVRRQVLTSENAKLDQRKTVLKSKLDQLLAETNRPNNALQARTSRLLISINEALDAHDAELLKQAWIDLARVVEDSKHLGDYPFERFAKLVHVMGDLRIDDEAFDTLFEQVVEVLETRRSETAGGEALLERGFQKLRAKKPYEAIRLFGRAQERFIKRECREELVSALMGSCLAYENVGLLWAARNNALSATERCLAHFWEEGIIIRPVLPCLQKLIWLELQLGRIAHVLELLELADVIISQLNLDAKRLDRLSEERNIQEGVLGMLFLNASIEQLGHLETLPDVLEKRGLFLPKVALLYALGYRDELRNEGFSKESFSDGAIDEFMQKWIDQPASSQLPKRPNLLIGGTVEFTTNVLGCDLSVSVANNENSIFLAEALLGATEAFLATSLNARIMPFRSTARIVITPSAEVKGPPQISEIKLDGEAALELIHAPDSPVLDGDNRSAYRDALQMAIMRILTHIAIIDDVESYLEKVAGEERGFGRALTFSEIEITTENIFGKDPRLDLTKLANAESDKRYPLLRCNGWSSGMPVEDREARHEKFQPTAGEGEMPQHLRTGLESVPHRERRIHSLIDIPLWNQAKWSATLYAQDPSKRPPLLMGLGFREIGPAREIFEAWRKRLGEHDLDDILRVTIITGVDKSNPFTYSVLIGTNLKFDGADRFAISVSRVNQMTPQNSTNLDRFLAGYARVGRYVIAPVHYTDMETTPEIHADVGILKSSLVVRPAWEIGENDTDFVAIREGDDPIIPEGVVDAPVLKTLARWRDKSRSSRKP